MINIAQVNGKDEWELLGSLAARNDAADKEIREAVSRILKDVQSEGDTAVRRYTEKFDGVCLEAFEVEREEINDALTEADSEYISALLNAQENIADFHNRQKQQGFINPMANGCIVGQRVRGLERVGIYAPGGTASYPSSVLMAAIPAKIAGVGELILATPPMKDGRANPDILAAAAIAGIDRVFLMGGAQAIAALAYGTETVPKADKIVGPGNGYVAAAQKMLFGTAAMDMIAGPNEILIMADETSRPKYIAADMISQAEHGAACSGILLTTSEKIARQTAEELERQTAMMERRQMITQSIQDHGAVLICEDIEQMIDFANLLAPEHLEVMLENPMQYLGRLDNAGAISLGQYSPEALGNYYAGPNHILPTNGTARFFSPLSVDSFMKKSSFVYYTQEALLEAKEDIVLLANKEGLTAHAHSVEVRFE